MKDSLSGLGAFAPARGASAAMAASRMCRVAAVLIAALSLLPMVGIATAAAPQSVDEAAVPEKVKALLDLLAEPSVQTWLEKQRAQVPEPAAEEPGAAIAASTYLDMRLAATRDHLAAMAAALPTLYPQIASALNLVAADVRNAGVLRSLVLILTLIVLGGGTEWVAARSTRHLQGRAPPSAAGTPALGMRVIAIRLAWRLFVLAAFVAGSVTAFLVFAWPPVLRQVVLAFLVAVILLRIVSALAYAFLAPNDDVRTSRILPMSRTAARFWYQRIIGFSAWLILGWTVVHLADLLGFAVPARRILAYVLGLGLLAIAVETVWRAPRSPLAAGIAGSAVRIRLWLLSALFVLVWLLWTVRAMPAFWFIVIAATLRASTVLARRSLSHLLDTPGAGGASERTPSVTAVIVQRGVRALLIIAAVVALAWGWNVDLVELTTRQTAFTQLVRAVINGVVIILIADLVWRVARAVIDRRLVAAQTIGGPEGEAARREARLRTLLPILRNILLVIIVVMAVLMTLSTMGFEIAPLLAGAGVLGVAIGFGAQTVVKDVISGMFYLLDDAFRVGEYIQTGSYKGTVESFSLRSVKLRHHRGPLYTVPFGELGAVQNMSRDWVIDKLMIGVTYDSDLELAKRLIKQIGKDLTKDPEFGRHIIESLKMQGVEQFGDYAIQLRLKMSTKPGEQFPVRRRAYAMIKKAFDEHGIRFASPTVQVSGGSDTAAAAVASRVLKPSPPTL